jgi:hypothetical protein
MREDCAKLPLAGCTDGEIAPDLAIQPVVSDLGRRFQRQEVFVAAERKTAPPRRRDPLRREARIGGQGVAKILLIGEAPLPPGCCTMASGRSALSCTRSPQP